MPRSYRHISEYEKEIIELKEQGNTTRDVANIEFLKISLKDTERINVPDYNYELVTETELEKGLEKENNSDEKIKQE